MCIAYSDSHQLPYLEEPIDPTMWTDDKDDDMMSHDDMMKMPIHQKAMDIVQMVLALKEYIDTDDEMRRESMQFMIQDAMQIPPKISSAMAAGLYDLKMENAAIIRKCARQVMVGTNDFRGFSKETDEYLDLLRKEIDEFRFLFVDWVATFDPWNYIIDRWGLFNPPGVSAHDKDPDEDIPFDPAE